MWVATGLMAGFIYLPRATRLAIDTLAVLAGADGYKVTLARNLIAVAASTYPVSVRARSAETTGSPRAILRTSSHCLQWVCG